MRDHSLPCLLLSLPLLFGSTPGLRAEPPGFAPPQLWASDALAKVLRSDAAPSSDAGVLSIRGARLEIASGQAVFRPAVDVARARAAVTDLVHRGSGAVIPAGAIRLQWVRYIDITRNSEIPPDERVAQAPASIPDPFWEDEAVPVRAGAAQPIWLEVRVPADSAAGDYDGCLSVTADGASSELPVAVHVWDFTLPQDRHLSVVNWWQFPGPGFEGRGPDDWELLRRFAAFLVDHRQTDLAAALDRIAEAGDAQTGFTHDTTRLERYAETAFAAGIRQIHLHSVGRRTAGILDPSCRIEPNQPSLRRLAAWDKVIQRRGWQGRFVTSIADEPFVYYEDSYQAVVDRVHEVAPSVRCLEAVETEYLGKLDVYVPKLSHLSLWYPRFDQVRREGAELWFYVCCHPLGRYPNRFLDQSLLKARVLFWIDYLYDLDGYLHWGLNYYGGDPYTEEGISKDLPLGDRAIVYPGKDGLIGSLRFSAQRDGIQDYEYMWLLESRLRELKARAGADAYWLDPRQRPLELCRRVIWSFHDHTRDSQLMLDTRDAIAREIEALAADPALVVQTSPPEGTIVPAGPRAINVRGLAPAGARVTVNGEPALMRPSGYFCRVTFLGDDQPTITVEAEHDGRTLTARRTFVLAD